MILVDSGFLLALAQPTDALHRRAAAWAQQLSEPLLVTEYILCEVINSLSKRPDRPRARRIAEMVMSDPGYTLANASPTLFQAGMQFHSSRPDKEWSLTDCISFQVMQERGISRALAYDIHFEQAGFEALLRKDPPP
ncbi:MAG: type II toxin-antitoxin system VapC family toxin [Verrucomicrobia bacterium]|nr:type II toxin-antitoxin system VapC family toxin [Verrucomicrobiota bacterium]